MKIIQTFNVKELDGLIQLSRNADYKEVNYSYQKGIMSSSIDDKIHSCCPKFVLELNSILNEYLSHFNTIPYNLALESMEILKYPEGTECGIHCDRELITDDNRFSLLLITSVLFLNDDFDGGELVLPYHNEIIKPKFGKLVMFPCGFMVPHGVNKVISGERRVVISNFAVPSPN